MGGGVSGPHNPLQCLASIDLQNCLSVKCKHSGSTLCIEQVFRGPHNPLQCLAKYTIVDPDAGKPKRKRARGSPAAAAAAAAETPETAAQSAQVLCWTKRLMTCGLLWSCCIDMSAELWLVAAQPLGLETACMDSDSCQASAATCIPAGAHPAASPAHVSLPQHPPDCIERVECLAVQLTLRH